MEPLAVFDISSNRYLTTDQLEHISTADATSSALSILGCVSIIAYTTYKRKICNRNVWPLFQLSLADLLASITLLLSTILHKAYPGQLQENIYMPCAYINGLTAGFYVITFFLTSAYAVDVYLRVSKVKSRDTMGDQDKRNHFLAMYLMYTMSWILPIAAVVCMAAYYSTVHQGRIEKAMNSILFCNATCIPFFSMNNLRSCGPQYSSLFTWLKVYKLMFLIPLLFSFSLNVFLYILSCATVARGHRQKGMVGHREYKELKRVRRRAVLFLSVFFICWFPSVLIGILSSVEGEDMDMKRLYALYMCQAALSPLQGLLNAIVYGWHRRSFIQAVGWKSS